MQNTIKYSYMHFLLKKKVFRALIFFHMSCKLKTHYCHVHIQRNFNSDFIQFMHIAPHLQVPRVVLWPSGRASDSVSIGPGLEPSWALGCH